MPESRLYAGIHILDVPYSADIPYSYSVPEEFAGSIHCGSLAVVPFGQGNRFKLGLVTSLADNTDAKRVKPIYGLPLGEFSLGENLTALCAFMKDTLFCTVGEAVKAILPTGVGVKSRTFYSLLPYDSSSKKLSDSELRLVGYIGENTPEYSDIASNFESDESASAAVRRLISRKIIKANNELSFTVNTKTENFIVPEFYGEELERILDESCRDYTKLQKESLKIISENPPMTRSALSENFGISAAVITALIKKGAVKSCAEKVERNPYSASDSGAAQEEITLSDEQQSAFRKLLGLYSAESANAALLYGVTGSGKTKVIQKMTDAVIADGKDAIILIPEIALTPQTVRIFIERYGDRVSVIHSGLSAGERTDAWRKIKSSAGNIVIGTRSAVFAPVPKLGMIVLDEEQESSFKSDMNPKYHARDIARFRCAHSNALMVLSSATPSLESFKKAEDGRYNLIKLTERYGNAMLPTVTVSDLRGTPHETDEHGKNRLIGDTLFGKLSERLAKKEQSVLFLNKRGYNSLVACRVCGYTAECPNCSVSLTYHKYGYDSGGRLVCHYCGYVMPIPTKCPECSSEHIGFIGTGIQMLEEELHERLPEARVLRMDLDTTSGKFGHDKILDIFRNGGADILVGTQMVAKGHDFGRVSLVGVVLADAMLYLGDFRASERTFSLLTQVIGRAGRADIPGEAVIQTYSPDNEVLKLAATQDYEAFYKGENELRRATEFPPYCDIVTVTFTSDSESDVVNAAHAFGKDFDMTAKTSFSDVRMIVYGPFKAGIYKLVGKYRMRYIIKCRNTRRQRQLINKVYTDFYNKSKGMVSISIDVNPTALM